MNNDFKSFYFKSTVLFVDDNESFLEHVGYKLCDDYSIETFSNPQQALQHILSCYSANLLPKPSDLIVERDNEDTDDLLYSVDLSAIKQLAKERNKSHLISVVIVDYSMPLMNGIEFCQQIAHLPVLKVMLTGHADFKLAVDAFNAKIIDKFLVKDSNLMLDEIKAAIERMQNQYFERLSQPLLNCFSSQSALWLTSEEYINHLQQIVKQLYAVEYYLLNQMGSYLLISDDGSKHYFMSISSAILDEYIDIAKDYECEPELIKQMVNRTHAPFFLDETDYQLAPSQWHSLMQPIQRNADYYWCIRAV